MRRSKSRTPGIYSTESGYEVDKRYKGTRLRQCGFRDFDEAQSWLITRLEELRQVKVLGQQQRYTFEEAASYYLSRNSDKPSVVSEIYHLKAVMPFIGKLYLEEISDDALQEFVEARRKQGRKAKTINLSLGVVRLILNLAARQWRDGNGRPWLGVSPLIKMLPLVDQRPPQILQWDEQRRLLPALPDHLAEMALFTLNTGVRDDVVCSLQWQWEVPLKALGVSIFVVPPEHVKGEAGRKKARVLVCNTVAQSIIERQRGKHNTHVFVYRRERVVNNHLAPAMEYRPIRGMNNTAWQNARRSARLGDLHVHDLRHTVGSRLREVEVSEQTRSDILWHSTRTMTQHYSMANVVEIFEALEKIKQEGENWNKSLDALIREAQATRFTADLPAQKQTG